MTLEGVMQFIEFNGIMNYMYDVQDHNNYWQTSTARIKPVLENAFKYNPGNTT